MLLTIVNVLETAEKCGPRNFGVPLSIHVILKGPAGICPEAPKVILSSRRRGSPVPPVERATSPTASELSFITVHGAPTLAAALYGAPGNGHEYIQSTLLFILINWPTWVKGVVTPSLKERT